MTDQSPGKQRPVLFCKQFCEQARPPLHAERTNPLANYDPEPQTHQAY